MTYCLGIKINKGLLFMSDTRTNAGDDNISTFKKIYTINFIHKKRKYSVKSTRGEFYVNMTIISFLFMRQNNQKIECLIYQTII